MTPSTGGDPGSPAVPSGRDSPDWPESRTSRRLTCEWLMASTFGALAASLSMLVHQRLSEFQGRLFELQGLDRTIGVVAFLQVIALALAMPLAITPQWWVLHRHIAGAGRWFLGTLCGFGVGLVVVALPVVFIVGTFASGPGPERGGPGPTGVMAAVFWVALWLQAGLFGAITGAIQVRTLRAIDARGDWWWVPANALGMLLLWGIELIAALNNFSGGPLSGSVLFVGCWILGGMAYGVPTGLVLPRHLRRHPPGV
jgi:hypothetical protein